MSKSDRTELSLAKEQVKLHVEGENYVSRMQSIATYAESLTYETMKQFTSRYSNIPHLVSKFDDLQLRIVDFNSRVTSPDLKLDVESIQLQFDDLVYKSQDMYLSLTETSTPESEYVDIKPTMNVPVPRSQFLNLMVTLISGPYSTVPMCHWFTRILP